MNIGEEVKEILKEKERINNHIDKSFDSAVAEMGDNGIRVTSIKKSDSELVANVEGVRLYIHKKEIIDSLKDSKGILRSPSEEEIKNEVNKSIKENLRP